MRNSRSTTISSHDAQCLIVLDWWFSNNEAIFLKMMETANLDDFVSTKFESIGETLVGKKYDELLSQILKDINENSLGEFIFYTVSGSFRPDEVYGRVGLIFYRNGWIEENRKTIEFNRKRFGIIKKVMES